MKIYLASTSGAKKTAVELAFSSKFQNQKFEIIGINCKSGVSPQPFGEEETILGASNRMKEMESKVTEDYDFLVSCEGGFITYSFLEDYYGFGATIIKSKEGLSYWGFGGGIRHPKEFVEKIKSGEDASDILRSEYGIDDGDVVSYFTQGKMTRADAVAKQISIALENI
ncbi:MAG: DUF84 family protein [Candidatus Dojkabacteria bacterium]|nr:DUF84 family protein [Candidatus Dojkabacteria bacterium]MDQ7020631.1 DUF84 family protein [Candidatus Dojkabacteria bacterium]